ncbi:hypothetical protein V2J09_010926 [Rumex salicifolius]
MEDDDSEGPQDPYTNPWGTCIFVRSCNKSGVQKVSSLWRIWGTFYVVKFANVDDLNFVLTQGPWLVGDRFWDYRWSTLTGGVLTQIGRRVGKVMKFDKTTIMGERGRYTRMCVQVDLEAPLLSKLR